MGTLSFSMCTLSILKSLYLSHVVLPFIGFVQVGTTHRAQELCDNLWSHSNILSYALSSGEFLYSFIHSVLTRLSSKLIHHHLGKFIGLWRWRIVLIRRILSPNMLLWFIEHHLQVVEIKLLIKFLFCSVFKLQAFFNIAFCLALFHAISSQ